CAPQLCGAVQRPQLPTVRGMAQLSVPLTVPQFLPSRRQNAVSDSAVQPAPPHTPIVPLPPQVCGEVHMPQLSTDRGAAQLSVPESGPQFFPMRAQNCGSVSLTQPQTFAVTAPQLCGAAHTPQLLAVCGIA